MSRLFPAHSAVAPELRCSSDIGRVTSIRLHVAGSDRLFLETLQVVDYNHNDVLDFGCNCWFGSGSDGASDRTLYPGILNFMHL